MAWVLAEAAAIPVTDEAQAQPKTATDPQVLLHSFHTPSLPAQDSAQPECEQVQPQANELPARPEYADKIAALQEEIAYLKAGMERLSLEASTRPTIEVRHLKLLLAHKLRIISSSQIEHLQGCDCCAM